MACVYSYLYSHLFVILWFYFGRLHFFFRNIPSPFLSPSLPVFAGYVANSTISHNTMHDLPYSGVQVGWGWGQNTFAGRNAIMNNSIDGVLAYFADGGCIYSQSNMHGSVIAGNWLQHDGNRYGVIYTDGASNCTVMWFMFV